MPGKVTGALVQEGEQVKAGDPLVMIESMKMEIPVEADASGEVLELHAAPGDFIEEGDTLISLD
ncbi:MAG: acetyl-CoA carboxylase biotin carboxyl carrier protein subunit [Nitrososphaerota archaeon]|nr:acetyl-CoA carboxylase biotin carboxyl carrier protein subunit [Nitrososphaerota archaeon]